MRAGLCSAVLMVVLAGCNGQATTAIAPTTTTMIPNARPTSAIEVYGNCTTPSVEPRDIVLTCADYGWVLQGLHWTSWTPTKATAVGTFVYNDCTPNCADGHHHDVYRTRVTLSVPLRDASGRLVWSELRQHPEPPGYEPGPLHGAPFPLTRGLSRNCTLGAVTGLPSRRSSLATGRRARYGGRTLRSCGPGPRATTRGPGGRPGRRRAW